MHGTTHTYLISMMILYFLLAYLSQLSDYYAVPRGYGDRLEGIIWHIYDN